MPYIEIQYKPGKMPYKTFFCPQGGKENPVEHESFEKCLAYVQAQFKQKPSANPFVSLCETNFVGEFPLHEKKQLEAVIADYNYALEQRRFTQTSNVLSTSQAVSHEIWK